jgi:hypothetical protein
MRLARFLPVALVLAPGLAGAGGPVLDPAYRQGVVEKTADIVRANYVFPERAETVASVLLANARAGRYATPDTPDAFLETLNRDMQSAAGDRHVQVIHNPRMAAQLKRELAGETDASPEFVAMLRASNFRLRKVESLDGNVGYFKFDNFVELKYVERAFLGAMDFLHESSALILDLTDNGGGPSETADLLVSYFLPEGTRVGETWNRATNETTPSVVRRPSAVRPLPDVPLYILVGGRTASAAEAVAYTLQQARRAVIVGSPTKGLANAGQHFLIDDRLFVMVPTLVHRNAVTGTNWEGVGVKPDVDAVPGLELSAAMAAALHELAGREGDAKARYGLLFASREYEARLDPEAPPAGLLDACLGEYDDGSRIVREEGALWFTKGEIRRRMSYLGDDTFTVEGRKDYRLRFPFEGGKVARCEVLWFDDTSDTRKRVR